MKILFLLSLLILATVPLWFIWHKVYKDGVFGRFSLCGISLMSWVFLLNEYADGWDYAPLPEVTLLIANFAVFLIWHLARFEYRVVKDKMAAAGEIDRRGQRTRG